MLLHHLRPALRHNVSAHPLLRGFATRTKPSTAAKTPAARSPSTLKPAATPPKPYTSTPSPIAAAPTPADAPAASTAWTRLFVPKNTPAPVPDPPGIKYMYPSRLLIYYTGKRIIYLGTLKLYSVLLFSYTSLLIAPTLFPSPLCLVAFLGSAVPLAAIQWFSPSYVTHAYLRLPAWARVSEEALGGYVRGLGKGETVELAGIRWFGRPRVEEAKVGELRHTSERLGCVNFTGRGKKYYMDLAGSPVKVAKGAENVAAEVLKKIVLWTEEGRAKKAAEEGEEAEMVKSEEQLKREEAGMGRQ